MKVKLGNFLLAAAFLIFPLTILLYGEYYWDYRRNVMIFPWMAGALVIISSIWLLVRTSVLSLEELGKEGETVGEGSDHRSSLCKRAAWLVCVFPLCYFFGLLYGLVAYTLAYTSYHRLPLWQRAFAMVVVFLVVFGGFYTLLGVPIPMSPLWLRQS